MRKIVVTIALASVISIFCCSKGVEAAAEPRLQWSKAIPGATIRESSPMPISLQGGSEGVVVGALNGQVYIVNGSTGNYVPGWPQSVHRPVNASAGVADVDGDGRADIFVGAGTADAPHCSGGGMYRFRDNGSVVHRVTTYSSPRHCIAGVQSSPAIGDIDNDNRPDITFGTLGLRMWSVDYSGATKVGWPMYWDDTQFASPALLDANGDGVTDVVMGGDSSPGLPVDFRGGMVRAISGFGHTLWEYRLDEMVRSSPTVGDVDGDGVAEVVFGAGNYWAHQPGGARDSTKIFVLDSRNGRLKWSKDLGGQTLAAPALADINGDGVRDIIIGTWQGVNPGRVWALRGDGGQLPGFPRISHGGIVIGQVSVAELNNDDKLDIVVPTGGGVFAYSGADGALLWGLRQGVASYQNTPYLGDIDKDGFIDIVLAGTRPDGTALIDRFELTSRSNHTTNTRDWRMFRGDGRLTGNALPPPIRQQVAVAPGEPGMGYIIAASDGSVYCFGSGRCRGGVVDELNRPIVGVSAIPGRDGYWLVASDGGIFSFGDAAFHGSTGNIRLNKPIVGIMRSSRNGYWLIAEDGGVFSFGQAAFYGSPELYGARRAVTGVVQAVL